MNRPLIIFASVAVFLNTPVLAADDVIINAADGEIYNWSGAYVGATLGYGFGTQIHCGGLSSACPVEGKEHPKEDIDGIMGGITVGYNHQMTNNVLLGFEADFNIGDNEGSSGGTDDFDCSFDANECISELDWFATARVRAGYAMGNILPFVTAGLAVSRVTAGIEQPKIPAARGSDTHASFVAGAGVEVGVTQNLSVKFDGLYIFDGQENRYDSVGACGTPGCYTDDNDFGAIRLGINYRF